MIDSIKHDKLTQFTFLAFLLLTIWWLILFLSGSTSGNANLFFGAIYGTSMSIFGSFIGLYSAKHWGGWDSLLGKAVNILSLGLLAQAFGQIVFSYFNIFLLIEIPYPSLADLGYFGNIPLYIFGSILLAKASGVKVSLQSFSSQMQAILIPVGMVILSYLLFLYGYEFDWSNPIKIILDFGYPIGQALYVSIAILTYSLSRKILGGIMQKRIFLFILAFVAQYIADSNFLYQSINGTWYNGGYGDYLYLIAYFLMTLAFVQLRRTAVSMRKG